MLLLHMNMLMLKGHLSQISYKSLVVITCIMLIPTNILCIKSPFNFTVKHNTEYYFKTISHNNIKSKLLLPSNIHIYNIAKIV
jgi:hypothetical protein